MNRTENRLLNAWSVFFFICLFSFITVQAQEFESSSKMADIEFETEVIDYGSIMQNSDGLKVFTFTNTGNAPLLITNVKSSCGCTVPTYSKEAILPGEKGQIEVKYDTKRLGAFSKTITVFSNSKQERKTLKIKGSIEAAG
jgi:hypothetical protein